MLLTHDGSTTRLCQALTGAPVGVYLHHQHRTTEVPTEVRDLLAGEVGEIWLQRVTSLYNTSGEVLMDNLSFTRLNSVPDWFIQGLDEGQAPIGHLLDQLFVKRKAVTTSSAVQNLLWDTVGKTDALASRSYQIATSDHAFMLIFEVFRGALTPQETMRT